MLRESSRGRSGNAQSFETSINVPGFTPNESSKLPAPIKQAAALFVRHGWSPADATWLSSLLLPELPADSEEFEYLGHLAEHNIETLAASLKEAEGDRDAGLLVLLSKLLVGWRGGLLAPTALSTPLRPMQEPWELPQDRIGPVCEAIEAHGDPIHRVLRAGWPPKFHERDRSDEHAVLAKKLIAAGAIRIGELVDKDRLRSLGQSVNWQRWYSAGGRFDGAYQWNDGINTRDTWSLRAWVWIGGEAALKQFWDVFQAEPDSTIGPHAISFVNALDPWLQATEHRWKRYTDIGPSFMTTMARYFGELDARLARGVDNLHLRVAWLYLAPIAFDNGRIAPPVEVRKRLVRIANEELAKLRPVLVESGRDETWSKVVFQEGWRHWKQCRVVLAHFGGLWACLKPLILALRALRVPATLEDLRYWGEPGSEPPQPWSIIMQWLVDTFHVHVRTEQTSDAQLTRLRTQLAEFILERLVDRWTESERKEAKSSGRFRTNADMVEPSAPWRYYMIRGLMDLHINPGGRGHRTLFHASNTDPDPHVREVAGEAYEMLRHQPSLPKEMSPRRAIMSVFWWFRWAHLHELGIKPDPDGAQRTRAKELTRTKDFERQEEASVPHP